MQKLLTPDGRVNSNTTVTRTVTLTLINDGDTPKKVILCRSSARTKNQNVAYNSLILKEAADTCVMEPNAFFKTLDDLQAFVMACPTRLHAVLLQPVTSSNFIEQTGEAVKINTPTFEADLIENIAPVAHIGGALFQLHDFYLGGVAEVEITVQPKTTVKTALSFGAYMAERLVK